MADADYELEWYDEDCDDDLYSDSGDPCDHCGPHCGHWGGDGLCMLEIEELARQHEEYEKRYYRQAAICPVCRHRLPRYDIETDELWVWPGGWYSPIIGLEIYAAYGMPKGEIHRAGNVCHIWIGEGEARHEKLVRLLGGDQRAVESLDRNELAGSHE